MIFKSCGKCDNFGFLHTNNYVEKCECRKEYESNLRLYGKLIKSNLLKESSSDTEFFRLLNYKLSDYKGKDLQNNLRKLDKFVNHFSEKFASINLYFWGDNGTQKTTLAKWILTSLLKKNFTVYYILTKDLIDLIMQSERDETKAKILDFILNVDCLVLEEAEVDKMALYQSGYKEKVFAPFLKSRLEIIRKSTIFISNSSIPKMKENMEKTIADLIERETIQGVMKFEDNYIQNSVKEDIESIWD